MIGIVVVFFVFGTIGRFENRKEKKYGSIWNNGLYFWAWCSWENYYVGKTTQRIWCPERKSGIWKELNETPLAQIAPPSMRAKVLRAELKYLNGIPEIQWWEVVENMVFMSFSPVPNDYVIIIRDAALKGNKRIDFGVHVWAVKNQPAGWRPGNGPYLGVVTARYGKFEEKD